jgi:hypothetical protein
MLSILTWNLAANALNSAFDANNSLRSLDSWKVGWMNLEK